MKNHPEISICIVNWNTRDDLEICLDSIKRCQMNVETIVCDNASNDGSAEMVGLKHPETILIKSAENLGFGRGNNLCAEKSHGEFLLIANPDIIFAREAMTVMRDTLRSDPNIGAVGPRLVNPDGTVQRHYYRKFPSITQVILYHTILKAIFFRFKSLRYKIWEDNTDTDKIVDVNQPPGACIMVRGDLFRKLGGFDERFILFYEDVDLCRRIKYTDSKIVLNPRAQVVHSGQSSLNRELQARLKLLFFRSGALYFKLHGGVVRSFIYKTVYITNELAKILIRLVMVVFDPKGKRGLRGKIRDSLEFVKNVLMGKRLTLL